MVKIEDGSEAGGRVEVVEEALVESVADIREEAEVTSVVVATVEADEAALVEEPATTSSGW